jgi:glycerophosphoryl diester phosphodiesterase
MTENDMTGLLLQLADLGVTGIKIIYSGGGDSGAIDDIIYTTEEVTNLEDLDDLDPYSENVLNLRDLSTSLYSDIEDFATSKLLDEIEDWWNNEGGHGTVLIAIPSGDYTINNNIYISNTEEYIHNGNLINQSLN